MRTFHKSGGAKHARRRALFMELFLLSSSGHSQYGPSSSIAARSPRKVSLHRLNSAIASIFNFLPSGFSPVSLSVGLKDDSLTGEKKATHHESPVSEKISLDNRDRASELLQLIMRHTNAGESGTSQKQYPVIIYGGIGEGLGRNRSSFQTALFDGAPLIWPRAEEANGGERLAGYPYGMLKTSCQFQQHEYINTQGSIGSLRKRKE